MLGLLIAFAAATGSSTYYVGSPGITPEEVARKLGHGGKVESKMGLLYQVSVPEGTNLKGRFKVVLEDGPNGSIANLKAVTTQLRWLQGEKKASRVERETDFWEALEHYLMGRTDENGDFDFHAYARAIEHRDQMPLPPSYLSKTRTPVAEFEYLGPQDLPTPYRTYFGIGNLSGRKNGVTVAPDGTVFVASAQGGVWRSTNRGSTFQPLSDQWPAMATSCVVTHPTNSDIVLCGTGDKNRWPMPSMGIMRSTNKGQSWTPVTNGLLAPDETVTKIVFDPIDHQLVLAATTNFNNGGGLYRSFNAGETWHLVSTVPRRDWQDLDVSGVSSNGFRTWWAVASSANGPVIYRTYFPAGESWYPTPAPHTGLEMRVDVAASKIYPGTVYLLSSSMDTIYRSSTYGSDWVSVKNNFPNGEDNLNWSQDGYDFYINTTRNGTQDRLWVGLLTLAVSHNSGASWQDAGRTLTDQAMTHNDQHDLTADPLNPNLYWAVNDGGLYKVTLQGNAVSFDSSPNKTIYDVQAYRMSIHPSNNQYLTIGTQDNASPSVRGNFAAWWNLQGGDGGFSGYHPTMNGRHLSSSQGGRFYRYDGFTDTTGDELDRVPSGPFLTPMVYAGNGVPYAGSNALYRWDGDDWIVAATGFGNTIATIERGKTFGSKLFIGSTTGLVFRTSNLGPNRVEIGVFTGFISDIDESPHFNDRVLVAVQRGAQSRVMYTTNAGASNVTWSIRNGSGATSLPMTSINSVCFDPHDAGTFYAGTDVGLFVSTDYGQNWFNMNPLGLPNVQVNAIQVDPTRNFLYVATFGRGVWRVPLRPLRLHSVAFSRAQIFGGSAVDCTLNLTFPAPPGGVRLQTTWTANLVPPTAPVEIGAGQSSATVRVASRPVTATAYDGVYATFNEVTVTGLVVVHPLPRLVEYTVNPNQLYGGEGFEGQLQLNTVTPIDVWVHVVSDPALVNHAKHVRVRAGQSTASFQASTNAVTAVTQTTTGASFGGGSVSRELNLHALPAFTALAISPSRVYGGNPAIGTLHLSPAAPMEFFFGVASDSAAVTPPVAGYVAGKANASAPFTLNTNRRIADTTATITATFLHRTVTQTMTVMAYPLLTQFTLDKSTILAQGSTLGNLGLNVKVRHPGLDVLIVSNSQFATVPAKVPVPIGSSATSFPIQAGSPSKPEVVTLSASLDGKVLTLTLTIVP